MQNTTQNTLFVAIQKWPEPVGPTDDHERSYERPCVQELKSVRQKLLEVLSAVAGGRLSRSEEIDTDEALRRRNIPSDCRYLA